ncbi:MAG: acyl-CoA dehydrogenase family protein, partial [Anaerolineales bacterium]
ADRALPGALQRLAQADNRSAQWSAKDALDRFADSAIVALLYRLAETAGERYDKLARLYARRFLQAEAYPDWALDDPSIWLPVEAA